MRTRSQLGDVALALALVTVGIAVTSTSDGWDVDFDRPIDGAGYALIVAAGVPLIVRRRWPEFVLVAVAGALSSYLIVGYPYGPVFFPFFMAVYTLARHRPPARAALVTAAVVPLLLIHLFTNSAAIPGFGGVIPASAWVIVPFALGVTVRLTREAAARERADTLRQHLDDERLRVAQEVHDVVGHGLAAIKMQSDVALHLLSKKPEHAETALRTISRTSSDALAELRATLTVVRRSDAEAGRSPVPGLDRLDELRQRMSDAGVDVEVETVGDARPVPDAVSLAAYRVVQEALTNVLKHSESKVATVRVAYKTDAVVMTVSNPVRSVAGPSAVGDEVADGLGIPGMRRRVTSLGGELTAGVNREGRFEVRASIPTGGEL
ncbi:sensor histidine kinase [Phytoactinopolyspora endophytica]|uniref:sensor histidine kinase n=1 Tax=Phytoactinopolyspora endophytica TaxID=1642495 RepID=UPI00101DBC4A|nr:sensor histidine kinase [Phytoactinopolyspora endophytica]